MRLFLVRHGETAWSLSKQHTSTTDIPLTEKGEADALQVGRRLENYSFGKVLSSPRQRAQRTCELAGFGHTYDIDSDLVEWNYGDYEGITTKEIKEKNPNWNLFNDGCPKGESPAEIAARADRLIQKIKNQPNDVLCFSHGHFLRVLAVRWIELPVTQAAHFILGTSSISILGFEHSKPAISLWNDQD